MATLNFLYRSSREQASLTIRLLFRHNNKDFVLGAKSQLTVTKHYWTKQHKLKRVKDMKISNKQTEINSELNSIENHILSAFNNAHPDEVEKEWLQLQVDNYYNPPIDLSKADAPEGLIEYFDYYLKYHNHIQYGTSKKFITLKNKLEERVDQFGYGRKVLMIDMNDYFRDKYIQIFKDYSFNTVQQDLKLIKTLCRHAERKGIQIHSDVSGWTIKNKKTPIIYLSFDEIRKIQAVNKLPDYLENARDWLIISCYTGQRISDFMRFNNSMIRKEKNIHGKEISLIEFTQTKTGATIALPLHEEVLKILKKRNGDFPHAISDQKYNEYIKKVCEEAGITQLVEGEKREETAPESKIYRKKYGIYPKNELVTSHIGRRSYCTNYFGTIPSSLIMSASGHRSEAMLLKYIGKTQTEQAKQLADYF